MTVRKTQISETAIIGAPSEARLRAGHDMHLRPDSVSVGQGTWVMDSVIICHDTNIGHSCYIDFGSTIGHSCNIGNSTRIMYRAVVNDRVSIGNNCRISGLVCDGTIIDDNCHSFGALLHKNSRPDFDYWTYKEGAPHVLHHSVVGYGAKVIGPRRIGPYSYVAAGTIVTKDVPEKHVCTERDRHIPIDEWKGDDLSIYLDMLKSKI